MNAKSKDVVEAADEENELQNWWSAQDLDDQWIEDNSQ